MIKRLTTSSRDDRLRKAAGWYVRHEADAELSPPEWQAWEAWSANSENSAEYDEFVQLRELASGVNRPALPSPEEVKADCSSVHTSPRPASFSSYFRHRSLKAPATVAIASAALIAMVTAAAVILRELRHENSAVSAAAVSPGQAIAFSELALENLRASGRPVLVNLGADWCATCVVNERTLSGVAVRQMMARKNVAYLKGDWNRPDAGISVKIQRFGRAGVPLYLLYCPESAEPKVLPQILTEDIVLNALSQLPDQDMGRHPG
jgi:Thioredoxin-like